jgi:hypothetical protein
MVIGIGGALHGWVERPDAIRRAIRVRRKVHGAVGLVAPHDADLVVEGDNRRDIITGQSGCSAHRQDEGGEPSQIVGGGMGDVDLSPTRPIVIGVGDPHRAGGVFVHHNRFDRTVRQSHRKTGVQGIGLGSCVVAIPPEADAGIAADAGRDGTDDIQMSAVPQAIGRGRRAAVNQGVGGSPSLECPVEPIDFEVLRSGIEQATPPQAILKPQFALGFLAGGGSRAGVQKILVAYIPGGFCQLTGDGSIISGISGNQGANNKNTYKPMPGTPYEARITCHDLMLQRAYKFTHHW